jgi:hypothetical protein
MQCRKFKTKKDFFGQGSTFNLKNVSFKDSKEKPKKFEYFYPEADVNEIEYAIVCTQDCDIEQNKVTHLNIALLEPVYRRKKENPLKFLDLDFQNFIFPFEEINFYSYSEVFKKIKGEIEKLVSNDNNHYLFVNREGEFYFINLTKIFPIKFRHFESIKKHAKYQLDGSFKHLLGWRLAYIYGRVGVDSYPITKKDEIVKKIMALVGTSIESLWPKGSYELTEDQFKAIKGYLSQYKFQKEQKKDTTKVEREIYKALGETNFAKKNISLNDY